MEKILLAILLAVAVILNISIYKKPTIMKLGNHIGEVRGDTLVVTYHIPKNCKKVFGAEITYEAKGIIRKY